MTNSNAPDSLPSLELMKFANVLLNKAANTDRQKFFDLMESYDKTKPKDVKAELVGILFVQLILDPNVEIDDVYEQLKKLLIEADAES